MKQKITIKLRATSEDHARQDGQPMLFDELTGRTLFVSTKDAAELLGTDQLHMLTTSIAFQMYNAGLTYEIIVEDRHTIKPKPVYLACYGDRQPENPLKPKPRPWVEKHQNTDVKIKENGFPASPFALSTHNTELEAWKALEIHASYLHQQGTPERWLLLGEIYKHIHLCRGICPECGCQMLQRKSNRLTCPHCGNTYHEPIGGNATGSTSPNCEGSQT